MSEMDQWEVRRQLEVDRSFELQERQIAAQERLAEVAGRQHHVVEGDDALARMTAFWELPREQQNFRLREVAIAHACRLGGVWETVRGNADLIVDYIRGENQ